MLNQFLKFALVGGVGTALHYGVLIVLVEVARFDPAIASGCGALCGLIVNYALNRRFTFASSKSHGELLPRYVGIASIGFAINFALMVLLVNGYGVRYVYAQMQATALVLLWNFFANRHWTFRASPADGGKTPYWLGLLSPVMLTRYLTLGAYPLIDPTEARYSEMARKMVETGNWITPQIDYGVPFWGKPPLAVWSTALDVLAGGVNEFSVRLPAWLLGMASCLVVWKLAASRRPDAGSWSAPAILASCLLFFVMAGSVAMDQSLSLAITVALGSFWLAMQERRKAWGYVFFLALAAGLLAKGPIALILTGLPLLAWVLMQRAWSRCLTNIPWVGGTLLMLAVALPWYVLAERATPGFLEYFLIGEHWKRFTEPGWQGDLYGSGRVHTRGTIWLYGMLAAMPWTPLFLRHCWQTTWNRDLPRPLHSSDGWRLYCLLWMLSPLVFFTLSANIIWTYVLPGLPAFALLLAEWVHDRKPNGRSTWAWGLAVPAILIGALLLPGRWIVDVLNTQKPIVEAFHETSTQPDDRLHYLKSKPFSAQFYSAGHVDEIDGIDIPVRDDSALVRDYFVIRDKDWDQLPETTRSMLHVLRRQGHFLLASG